MLAFCIILEVLCNSLKSQQLPSASFRGHLWLSKFYGSSVASVLNLRGALSHNVAILIFTLALVEPQLGILLLM